MIRGKGLTYGGGLREEGIHAYALRRVEVKGVKGLRFRMLRVECVQHLCKGMLPKCAVLTPKSTSPLHSANYT